MNIGTESCYLAVHRENLDKEPAERVLVRNNFRLACFSRGLFVMVLKKFCVLKVVGINFEDRV